VGYLEGMATDGVYRTEGGVVIKVQRDAEGHLTVQRLRDGLWQPAPIGMAGLRINPTTRRLTPRQIAALEA
jgi:YD repeat-containing protein